MSDICPHQLELDNIISAVQWKSSTHWFEQLNHTSCLYVKCPEVKPVEVCVWPDVRCAFILQDVHWPAAVSHGSLCPRGVKTRRGTVRLSGRLQHTDISLCSLILPLSLSSLTHILICLSLSFCLHTKSPPESQSSSTPFLILNTILRCLFFYSSVVQNILHLFYIFLISADICTFLYVNLVNWVLHFFFVLYLRSRTVQKMFSSFFFLKPCTLSWVQSFLLSVEMNHWHWRFHLVKNAVTANGQSSEPHSTM